MHVNIYVVIICVHKKYTHTHYMQPKFCTFGKCGYTWLQTMDQHEDIQQGLWWVASHLTLRPQADRASATGRLNEKQGRWTTNSLWFTSKDQRTNMDLLLGTYSCLGHQDWLSRERTMKDQLWSCGHDHSMSNHNVLVTTPRNLGLAGCHGGQGG